MGASAGRVLLIPKGDWNPRTTYTGLDWVRHNGAAWVCKNTCTNVEPTEANADNWQMMARDGDGVTADTAMSDTSTNAVQNKVIKSYVDNSITGISDMTGATATQNGAHGLVPAPQIGDEKKVLLGDGTWGAIDDKFTFSDNDTATSGTSFTDAEDGNMLVTDWTKNLLNPTLETTTRNGITCTANGDGTYTLNGTATSSDAGFNLIGNEGGNSVWLTMPADGKIIFAKGDATSKIGCAAFKSEDGADMWAGGIIPKGTNIRNIYISVWENQTLNNVVIKPMLTTDLNATYDDFVPYGGYEIQSCGKNIVQNTLTNGTVNGITIALNSDHSISFNGTASEVTIFVFAPKALKSFWHNCKGDVKLLGCPTDSPGASSHYIQIWTKNDKIFVDAGKGIVIKESDRMKTTFGNIAIIVNAGVTLSNVVFKPMLTTDLNATYDDYEPYTGETITVTNDTESPAFGLKSHKGITNIISPGNVKCVYPMNESGKGVLDAMYNNELSKLKNAILTYKTKEEYDAAVANDKIPDGATVIKDYDD